jgi:gluconokinase
MSSIILAFDIGTSSARTALFDMEANRIAGTIAQETYPLITSADGGAELEPATLLRATTRCLKQTINFWRASPSLRGRKCAAVGVSCFWHSLVGCDRQGEPLTRIITWADARCRPDAARLRGRIAEKKAHAATGCMLRSSYWPAKLAWLRRTRGRVFKRVAYWMSPAEWLQFTLLGDANCALGMATGTGLLDPTKLDWNRPMLELAGISDAQLRPLSDEPSIVGRRLAARFPELLRVPWFPAVGDGAASNLGSGATRPGLAAINVGTSAALRVMREGREARAPFGLFCYRVDARRFLVGGAVSNAGNLRAWCLRELKLPPGDMLDAQLAARPAPPPGLTVLPFWTAERAPTWDEEQTGVIHGLTQHTTAVDMMQAITDASYHRLRRIAEMVLAGEKRRPKFIVSGGIHTSPVALQRFADVIGFSLYPNHEPEASLRGAAIYALEKIGGRPRNARLSTPVRPRMKWAREHAREREKQVALEALLSKRRL